MKRFAMTCGMAVVLAGMAANTASAAFLYFNKRPVKTESEATCFSFARDVAQRNLVNVHFTPGIEAAGSHGGAYASITCVGGSPGRAATAIVMVVGDNQLETRALADMLGGKMAGIVRFD